MSLKEQKAALLAHRKELQAEAADIEKREESEGRRGRVSRMYRRRVVAAMLESLKLKEVKLDAAMEAEKPAPKKKG